MRDYTRFDKYVDILAGDIYPQPPDILHDKWTEEAIRLFTPKDVKTVLDVGCGQGIAKPYFDRYNIKWVGVTLGTDYDYCKNQGWETYQEDMTFMHFDDNSFDMIFARHVLEHSAFPVITLMDWNRISRKYLLLVLPSPAHFKYFGQNHYSVMTNSHALWLAARAGWRPVEKDYSEEAELRYLFEKAPMRNKLMWEREGQLEEEYGVSWGEDA